MTKEEIFLEHETVELVARDSYEATKAHAKITAQAVREAKIEELTILRRRLPKTSQIVIDERIEQLKNEGDES